MGNSTGSSIITSLTSGLTNTHAYLASLYPQDGVTIQNITKARNDQTNYLTLNQSFASYLQNNFNTFDKDHDGKISEEEMNKFAQTLSKSGVSKQELTQLASSGAYSSSTISKILDNFDEIDTNHDGRVTNAEISAYTCGCSKQEKMDEYNYRKATSDMSVFYGSETESTPDSYSILSYRYKNK
ncbi:EF-hand domain-containing protein [bacterium]|nr:EF-hand domain-containing protein [bacterium]